MPHSIELLASTRKKTKETIRTEVLLPSELREKSANLIDLLKDYYTHINEITQSSYEINSINNQRDIDLADSRIGKISAVSVTNRGSGYSNNPIVIVEGDGIRAAQITATVRNQEIIGFTILDGGLGYTYATITILDSDGTGATASPVISNARYLDLIQKEIAVAIPKNIVANRVNLYKNLLRYYAVRGSNDSVELFFRIILNDYAEVYYPREDLLIPSDGIWNTGRVPRTYTKSPDVIIQGNGSGARARATVVNGAVQYIQINNGGSGYSTAALSIAGDGTGATATATISNGKVLQIDVTDGGSGYTYGTVYPVTISGGSGFAGVAAEADAYVNEAGEIAAVFITNVGSGYTTATAEVDAGSGYAGTPADLSVTVDSTGVIVGVTVTNPGKNYTSAVVNITGDGSSANLQPHLEDGVITAVTAIDAGSGYTGNVTVTIPGGTENARIIPSISYGEIVSYDVVFGGAGYQLPGIRIENAPEGWYSDNKGFLSDDIKLQDSYFYQKFSYVIRTGNNLDTWKDSFNKLVHPAGFIYFADLLIYLQFLDTKAKMPTIPPGYIDPNTGLLNTNVFHAVTDLASQFAVSQLIMSLDVPSATNHNQLMRYFDASPINPYLSLTIREGDGFAEETPTTPLYPYADYTIDDVINTVITYNDATLGVNLI